MTLALTPSNSLSGEPVSVVLLGFDWGTSVSRVHAGIPGSPDRVERHVIPTLVGYARENVVPGLLPGNSRMLFGDDALKYHRQLDLVAPLTNSVVTDTSAASDFARHALSRVRHSSGAEVRAVIGLPANATQGVRNRVRQAVSGVFDRVVLVPKPYLAALGFRDETRLGQPDYADPARHSLFVDIGAGTVDLSLVLGCYPAARDQITLGFAGDKVDALFREGLHKAFPDCDLSWRQIRETKERFAFAGRAPSKAAVTIISNGRPRELDITRPLGEACEALVSRLAAAIESLLAQLPETTLADVSSNIFLTGGGSRMNNLGPELNRRLRAGGFENTLIRTAGEAGADWVAHGALKAARQVRENQWMPAERLAAAGLPAPGRGA